jgi:hypothetical protein
MLDVMHIEKNVYESLVKFLFGVKDTIKVHQDMEICEVKKHLSLRRDVRKLGNIYKLVAPYVVKLNKQKTFMNRLASLKVPIDYCGALGKHIMENKLEAMKSHD